jgi:uncharacterized cupredoxin-like copper-binding protein
MLVVAARRRRRPALGSVVAIVVVAAVAAGCGGDDGGGEQRAMTVVGTEMAFDAPDHVPAGNYAVTFVNGGAVHHELAFRNPDGEVVTRYSIAAGQRVVLDVELEPGTWELGCFEPGHYEGGMHRDLVVDEA